MEDTIYHLKTGGSYLFAKDIMIMRGEINGTVRKR